MKKPILKVCAFLICFASLQLSAQPFTAAYDFAGANTSSGRIDPTAAPMVEGITFGNFVAVQAAGNQYNLAANPNASGRFSFTGWPRGATQNSNTFTGSISTEQYYEVTLTPQQYYSLKLDSITFTVQRSTTGVRQYAVRSSLDGYTNNLSALTSPGNTNLQVVNMNTFQIADAAVTGQNGSKIDLTASVALASAVTFRFYGFNAEATTGTFSIDNVQFFGTSTLSPTAPIINLNTATLSFPSTPVNTTSQPLTYTVQANNLSDSLIIETAAPFSISTTADGTYSTRIAIPAANSTSPSTVYVKFSPVSVASFPGAITHNSTNATQKVLALSGEGIDATNLVFNFNACSTGGTPGSGFTAYSVSGAQTWACSGFGLNSTKGVDMNGFSGGPQENEDWLISPSLSLAAINLPVLRFWSRGEFVGPTLQLLISTNYDGFSDPNTATWTDLNVDFPPTTNTWTFTDGIDLSAYKTFPSTYIAFRYVSSVELGAARWNVDEIDITNRTQLVSTTPAILSFGEASAGTTSAAQSFAVKVIGYGDVTLTAPAGYQLSINNNSFTSALLIPQSTAEAGATVYARFTPSSKELKIEGKIRFTAADLDSARVILTGTSYPKAETFDAGTYNLSFFGSSPNNIATPEKITAQVNNIATVLQRLNLDVVGIQEVSNDDALTSLVLKIANRKAVISDRWSYSFEGPDPNFPPQKIGFIYDTTSMKLIESRVMFAGLYDSARNGYPEKLAGYPGGPVNFWAAGRLPFMATFEANINGVVKQVRVVVIHTKSSSDATSYNRRVYDVNVLKDSLNTYYKDDNILIVGDYNDRVIGSTYATSNSPFKGFVDDQSNYTALTLPFDQAGRISFIGGSALIDHIIISNELTGFNIANSTEIEDPRTYVNGYNGTTASDHFPVYSRFNFSASLPVTLLNLNAIIINKKVHVKWATANEFNNNYFEVERSANQRNYVSIARVKGVGNSSNVSNYVSIDALPLNGKSYYRLKQTDIDGNFTYSKTIAVNLVNHSKQLSIYPNPVTNMLGLNLTSTSGDFTARVVDVNGKLLIQATGDVNRIKQQVNQKLNRLKPGVYNLQISNAGERHTTTFIKQ